VRTVEAINQQYEFDEDVVLMDGGTQGLYLIQHVQAVGLLTPSYCSNGVVRF
jgi:hydrogenase maturation protease